MRKTVRFNISFPVEIDKQIENEARSVGMTKTFFIKYLVIKFMLDQKIGDKDLENEIKRMAKIK